MPVTLTAGPNTIEFSNPDNYAADISQIVPVTTEQRGQRTMAGTIACTTTTNATAPAPAAGPRGRGARAPDRSSPVHRGDWRMAWLLITPAMAGFLVFAVYPLLRGVYLSFTSFHVLSPAQWTGLANYRELIHDSTFWSSVEVTHLLRRAVVGIGIFFSLLTAVVLHRLTRSTVIRGLIILPFLISGVSRRWCGPGCSSRSSASSTSGCRT